MASYRGGHTTAEKPHEWALCGFDSKEDYDQALANFSSSGILTSISPNEHDYMVDVSQDVGGGSSSDSESDVEEPQQVTMAEIEEIPPIRSKLTIRIPALKKRYATTDHNASELSKRKLEDIIYEEEEYHADEDEEDVPAQSPIKYRRTERCARSPLSASSRGRFPVYTGYRCQIPGCDFAASTSQHLRHHMASAVHSRYFRLDMDSEG